MGGYGEQFFLITLEFSSLTTFGDVWRSCTALKLNGDGFVAKSCPNSRDPMDCSMPGFLVLYHLPEFAQTHVHRISDALQPSHPLSPPSPPALSLSQHQGLSLDMCMCQKTNLDTFSLITGKEYQAYKFLLFTLWKRGR